MNIEHSIKGVIIDLDGVINHAIEAIYKPERYKRINNIVNLPLKLNNISYPNKLNKFFWTFNDVIKEVGKFIYSIISINLSVGIFSYGNTYFLNTLLDTWPNIDKVDFYFISSTKNLDKNIAVMIKRLRINTRNLIAIHNVNSNLKLTDTINLGLVKVEPKINSNYKYDFISNNFGNIIEIIKKNILFDIGKLPNNFLDKLLTKYNFKDSSIIIGASVGEDTAAINILEEEVLLLKSDPITFSSHNIGYYSVLVNSNDMVTSGAMPKWILTTIMFPPHTSIYEIENVFSELYKTCLDFGISICGGHTEITNAVSRPVIVSTVVSTIKRKKLIDKKNVKVGDLILMTKGVAIEGTVVIASEFVEVLYKKGVSPQKIEKCLKLKSQISILKEAKIAWENPGVSALHDVTEGGILTAITELSKTSRHNVEIDIDKIVIYPETKYICDLFGINPLGLIGSGSLLICCNAKTVHSLINDLKKKDIEITIIGKISKEGESINTYNHGRLCTLQQFDVDELTRLYKLF